MLKPGKTSTEFILVAGVLIFGGLVATGVVGPEEVEQTTTRIRRTQEVLPELIEAVKALGQQFGGFLVMAGLAWAYLKRRTGLKSKELANKSGAAPMEKTP